MDISSFYTEHWREIEDERIARYEEMFVWQEGHKALLAPAALSPGLSVLDFGSGPGFFAGGLAGLVGPQGRVAGADINARFVADANARHADHPSLSFHHLEDYRLPFEDGTFDRVICKNVLEYVPDLEATLGEIRRVLKPDGLIHVIDSDWGFVIVQPWDKDTVTRFFEAAAPAFNEPYIGRRISGLLVDAGYATPEVRLSPFVDTSGRGLHVLRNMAGYINRFQTLPDSEVNALLAEVEATLDAGRFLFCLPQFLVTAAAGT